MAMNWTIAQAMKALKEGNDEVLAIGKSYPAVLVELVKAMDNEGAVKLLTSMPEKVTVRIVNDILMGGSDEEEVENDEEEVEEKKPSKRGRKPSGDSDEEKKAKAKARREARKAKAKAAEAEEEDEEESEENDYSNMSAMELYQLCKKRGLCPEQKKKPSYYIDMLNEADLIEADEDDEWEEEKPAKKNNKKAKAEEEDDDEWDI